MDNNLFYHSAEARGYPPLEQPASNIVHLEVPEMPTPEPTYDLGSRKARAVLAADISAGLVDLSTWPMARIAQALNASPRSASQALSLSPRERDDVRTGRRPLFPRPAPAPVKLETPIERLQRIVAEVGAERALDMLVELAAEKKIAA
jgi:hypothetical protein